MMAQLLLHRSGQITWLMTHQTLLTTHSATGYDLVEFEVHQTGIPPFLKDTYLSDRLEIPYRTEQPEYAGSRWLEQGDDGDRLTKL